MQQKIINRDQIDVYLYMTQKRVVPCSVVHHIVPLKEDWSRRLDPMNLIGLCHDTHTEIERMYTMQGSKIMAERLTRILHEYHGESNAARSEE